MSIFEKYNEDAYFDKLADKATDKSYYEETSGWRSILTTLSYLFGIASVASAAMAAYWVALKFTGMPWVAVVFSLVFLGFLETVKRKSSSEVWQVYYFKNKWSYGFILVSFWCAAISMVSSGFGGYKGADAFAPAAELVETDKTAKEYRAKVKYLEAENKELSKNRNHDNEIYFPTQKTIKKNKDIIAKYETRILDLDKKLEGNNAVLSQDHKSNVALASSIVLIFTLINELLFELSIWALWRIHWRCAIEAGMFNKKKRRIKRKVKKRTHTKVKAIKKTKKQDNLTPLSIKDLEDFETELKRRIDIETDLNDKLFLKQVKRDVQAYKYRLKKETGNPNTVYKNTWRYMKKLKYKPKYTELEIKKIEPLEVGSLSPLSLA